MARKGPRTEAQKIKENQQARARYARGGNQWFKSHYAKNSDAYHDRYLHVVKPKLSTEEGRAHRNEIQRSRRERLRREREELKATMTRAEYKQYLEAKRNETKERKLSLASLKTTNKSAVKRAIKEVQAMQERRVERLVRALSIPRHERYLRALVDYYRFKELGENIMFITKAAA